MIDVVNVLSRQQFSADVLLHQVSVLKNLLALSVDHDANEPVASVAAESPYVSTLVWSSHDCV